MIRQAYTYLVGALSAVVVIGVAIGVFVVLVCAQVFHELPIPVLSGHDQKTAVAPAKALSPADRQPVAVAPTGGTRSNDGGAEGAGNGATPATGGSHQGAAGLSSDSSAAPAGGHSGSGGGEASGGQPGAADSPPTAPASPPASNPSSSSSGNSGHAGPGQVVTGTSGSSGSSAGGGGSSGSSGSSGSAGSSTGSSSTRPSAPVTTAKPSEVITETVNKTVGSVDEAVGGTLSEVGVTHVTEEVVNGVAGPESVVGKTVEGVREVIGGLTGGSGH